MALLRPGGGIDTVVTADTYGQGDADPLVGPGPRGAAAGELLRSWAPWGTTSTRASATGRAASRASPMPACAATEGYADYLRMATERSLERCGVDRFDVLLLHNPDRTGYTSEAVWERDGRTARGGPRRSDRRGARPRERVHARPDRLPGALRRPDRLGDADPQPAGALAGRAGAPGGRLAGRAGDHPRRGLRRALLPATSRRATGSPRATIAASVPTAGPSADSSGSSRCSRSPTGTADAARAGLPVEPRPPRGGLLRADPDPGGRRGRPAGGGQARGAGAPPRRRRCSRPRRSTQIRAIGDNTGCHGPEGRRARPRGRGAPRPLAAGRQSCAAVGVALGNRPRARPGAAAA